MPLAAVVFSCPAASDANNQEVEAAVSMAEDVAKRQAQQMDRLDRGEKILTLELSRNSEDASTG